MYNDPLFIGNQKIKINNDPVSGAYIDIEGEKFYKISNYNKMTPFFMSIVSYSDHWMFISSNGGLTAGRKNPDNALFPYYTDDIIHTSQETTGSKTIIHVNKNGQTKIWEPFSNYQNNLYSIQRNIYKNIPGNKILFEEDNYDLEISFIYSWTNSEKFGFVKKSQLINKSSQDIRINILDGIQNILPYGVDQQFQNQFSTLIDGYKKNELLQDFGLGIYSLSSIPSDKAEPSESLLATSVWSCGIDVEKYLISSRQLSKFRAAKEILNENDIKASRGAYFINSSFSLSANNEKEWLIVSELNQDLGNIVNIKKLLTSGNNIKDIVKNDVDDGTKKLIQIVASADGIQLSNDRLGIARHFSNVLFNTMRGGIFDDAYIIDKMDFISFLKSTNKSILNKYAEVLDKLDEKISYFELKAKIWALNDNSLIKLFSEYLPLSFSRRHGDPSRPWNRFSIDIKNDKNEKVLNYQGNWRDIFQNWEALAISFPEYLEAMITKFLNASTADGYNPYKVTRDGFDWEAPEADMPWANIGYWGDHQIIYLLKLLALLNKYDSSLLRSRISDDIYAYANVPYRIKTYSELLTDAQNTIDFDNDLHKKIIDNEKEHGTDSRFLQNSNGKLLQVNLAEKLLVTLLSKLSNFIPGAGIWMNTQRPEWNDANNALVGNGASMVTLYYIRRYVSFLSELFLNLEIDSIIFSEEVSDLYDDIYEVFVTNNSVLVGEESNKKRKEILDGLGIAGEEFRNKIYKYGLSEKKKKLSANSIVEFLKNVKSHLDRTISLNKRDDGLYHSYNLIFIDKDEISITNLPEMLEGQVAVLSSGYLPTKESIRILVALKNSKLYRKDQNSYILYPDKQLPLFIDKNRIRGDQITSSKLVNKLIDDGNDEIIFKDAKGDYHFNGEIRNAKILKLKLEKLKNTEYASFINEEEENILNIYETHFNHKAFTGRSGTFYKYEGLGSIYWHMVSKLLLAVQENYHWALSNNSESADLDKIKTFYYNIKEGIGAHKSPNEYGAFPTDPYSHTPSFSGVQQPGMTGQVKEDIISRYGELGIQVEEGIISINPSLLNEDEFIESNELFKYYNLDDKEKDIQLSKGSLAFTYCQVPFVYSRTSETSIKVIKTNGEKIIFNEMKLSKEISNSIFRRLNEIEKVEVSLIV